MGMICKIFRFLLDVFKAVVDVLAEAIASISTAVVDVLSDVVGAVGDGLLSSPLGMAVVGVAVFALYKWLVPPPDQKREDKRGDTIVV